MAGRRAKIIRFPTHRPKTPAPEPPPAQLVEAGRCRDQTEALVVRGLLESEGIAVVLRSRIAPSVYPFSVGHQAEVLVLVAGADQARARAVLAQER